jgi:ATP-dependent DNA ligase
MGNNFSNRFPQIVAALTVLSVRSCLIDGEAVVCNESGLAVFATDATGQALGGRPRASEDQPS